MDTEDVGRLIGAGIAPASVTKYLRESRPGGRYAKHPFPDPDGTVQGCYFWLKSRAGEITEWDAGRPKRGTRTDLGMG